MFLGHLVFLTSHLVFGAEYVQDMEVSWSHAYFGSVATFGDSRFSSVSLGACWKACVYVHNDRLQNVHHFDSSGCDGFLFDGNIHKCVSGHTPV